MMREVEMRPAVEAWLDQRGCVYWHESTILGNADVVGVRFALRTGRLIPAVELAVAVELKVRDIATAIRQARHHTWYVHESYVAMPGDRCDKMRPRTLARFRVARVGLLAVDGERLKILVQPGSGKFRESLRKRLWRRARVVERARHD